MKICELTRSFVDHRTNFRTNLEHGFIITKQNSACLR